MVNNKNSLIEKLNETIDANLSDTTFSIESLSKSLGLSRSQLHRIIKKNFNFSSTLYIRHRKLLKARSLLETTSLRISEVAYNVGIDSPQNFTKYFAQAFALNPSEFRKINPFVSVSGDIETTELSIAVLPFVDMSSDKNKQYFSDGISEEIINMLSKVEGLKVIARTSSFAYKGKNLDLRVIGKQLNVSHVLEGSVRKVANKLRITVQLIKVHDGFQLWSDKFDSNIEDVFDIQDEISLKVLEEIKIQLFENERETVLKRYTDNHQAYQFYLHGRYYHNKFTGNEAFRKAISHFQSAIDLDPKYAIAYAGIASCYLNIWFYRYQLPEESLPQMIEATEKALLFDNKLVESHLAKARLELFYHWDFKKAESAFKKALEINPNNADVNSQYGLLLSMVERHDKALAHTILSLDLDSFSLINIFYAGYVNWMAGNAEEAIRLGNQMIDLEPNFWGGYLLLGFNYISNTKYELALTALLKANKLNNTGLTLGALGAFYCFSQDSNKARKILVKMEDINKSQPVSNYDFGIVYASLGETQYAFKYFEKAFDKHEPPMLFFKYTYRDWFRQLKDTSSYQKFC